MCAPSNVGAVWVTDSNGNFVKTLKVWGTRRTGNLYWWRQASKGSTVDAVTGATMRSHTTHAIDWNCQDEAHAPVPAGTYKVFAELAESNTFGPTVTGPTFNAPVEVGTLSVTTNPADDKAFTGKTIAFSR